MSAHKSIAGAPFEGLCVGQPFAPHRIFKAGIVPFDMYADRSLTVEEKLLYSRLLSYALEKSTCNPSLDTLCAAVAMSKRQVGRAIKGLVEKRYISRQRHGPFHTATIQLLWVPSLASSLRQGHPDAPKTVNQRPPSVGQNRASESSRMGSHDSLETKNHNKEEGSQDEGSHEGNSSTLTKTSINSVDPWASDEVDFIRGTLARHRYAPREPLTEDLPDWQFIKRYISNFRDISDFDRYWLSRGRSLTKPRQSGYGLYEADVKRFWLRSEGIHRVPPPRHANPSRNLVADESTVTPDLPLDGQPNDLRQQCATGTTPDHRYHEPQQRAPQPTPLSSIDRELQDLTSELNFQEDQIKICRNPQLLRWIIERIEVLRARLLSLNSGIGCAEGTTPLRKEDAL